MAATGCGLPIRPFTTWRGKLLADVLHHESGRPVIVHVDDFALMVGGGFFIAHEHGVRQPSTTIVGEGYSPAGMCLRSTRLYSRG